MDMNIQCDEELDEKICDRCSGTGTVEVHKEYVYYSANARCPKCQGKGKLDWIEQIVGVKPPEDVTYSCMASHTHTYCNAPQYTDITSCANYGPSHVHSAGHYGCYAPNLEHNHNIIYSKKEFS